MLTDSHCHLQFNGYNENREEVIKRCQEIGMLLNIVGTQFDTSKKAVELANKYQNFYATIGLHPVHVNVAEIDEEESHFVTREEKFQKQKYRELAKSEKVIAIGECGIDLFHLPKDLSVEKALEDQKKEFISQIELAGELDLAMVIHVRNSDNPDLPNAYDEVLDIFKSYPEFILGFRGTIHCYGGNTAQAEKFIKMGFYIGITGIITFPARKTNPKPTEDLIEVVKNTPIEKILIETDAPYLAPQKYRGKQCEPWMTEEVAKKIGEIKSIESDKVIEQTTENVKNLFKINS